MKTGKRMKPDRKKTTKRSTKADPGYTLGAVPKSKSPDYIVLELRHDSQISVSPTGFSGPANVKSATDKLNQALGAFSLKTVAPHFKLNHTQLRQRSTAAPASLESDVTADFAQAGFARIIPRRGKDCADIVAALNRNKSVWKAVIAPRPVPAAAKGKSRASRNFEPGQGYLHDAPNGIGAIKGWSQYRAKGKGVTICDIEGDWQFSHEDFSNVRHIGGELQKSLYWRDHGTAVLGEMVAQPNGHGVVGISHEAKAVVHAAWEDGIFSPETAIANSTKKMRAGDVILIELQAESPKGGKYIAMQYWDAVFSAIRAATAKGITVVEAAGNGNENFDRAAYRNSGLQKDSGAIVVGAGVPPTNYNGIASLGNPRSRIYFSNYGKIVDVQAWGWNVTTAGYGDAQGGRSERNWYTHRFSGTSSASPIVTGAVACIQSLARRKHGRPLSPNQVRGLLIATGTPQESGPGVPVRQHIGPQPNLPAALKHV